MAKSTLATRIARLDRERFVGRHSELERLAGLFGDEPAASVVLLYGPGGIGKSTLLRELLRRGERAGWTSWIVEGRDLPPDPDALEDALAGAQDAERPLLVLDTYERMTALDGYLRRRLLPRMPEHAVVLIAGRAAPDPAWSHGGWETLTVQLELGALADAEALELLHAAGVRRGRARSIAAWAGGSPLALTLAAEAAGADPSWDPAAEPAPPEVVEALIRRIADADVEGPHAGVLAAAAIGRVITPSLLRDALPGIDAEASYAWLAQHSVVERLGDGVALHDLVRLALRADVARSDPEFAHDLRVRIADHLHARAIAGELRLTIDLADLVESPAVRAGYSYQGATRYRIDALRPGDD
ncbi:MAG TPA: ATP-binding protein, partial [Solirubrobacteraceae bacterium]